MSYVFKTLYLAALSWKIAFPGINFIEIDMTLLDWPPGELPFH